VFEFSRIAFETSAAIKFQSARSAELARGRKQTPPIGAALEHFQFVARMERRGCARILFMQPDRSGGG
jgi:hypothetical protein